MARVVRRGWRRQRIDSSLKRGEEILEIRINMVHGGIAGKSEIRKEERTMKSVRTWICVRGYMRVKETEQESEKVELKGKYRQ